MHMLLDLMHRQFIRILADTQNENNEFHEQNLILEIHQYLFQLNHFVLNL